MAKTPRLSADRCEKILQQLTLKNIRPLWFDKFGPKMDVLFSREQILAEAGIDTDKMNALELKGLDSVLGLSIHNLKKFAQKRKYNWVEITISDPKDSKKKRVYYGFTTDIDQIDSNTTRFETYRSRFAKIANTTKRLGEAQKRELA